MVRHMLKEKRKILFVSERRADYSRLKPIMKAVMESKYLKMQLVVTGIHLLEEFGDTKNIIQNDGFIIDKTIEMFTKNHKDNGASMAIAMGKVLVKMPKILEKLKPTIVFCGFDLGANFAAAISAMHMNIHVAHIQGGEVSGTIDEIIRHAITKFAHIHFAATEKSRLRIIKLGENPKYVFNVGSPSIDTINSIDYYPKEKIFTKYGLDLNKKLIILVQHPVTTEVDEVFNQISQTIAAVHDINRKFQTQSLAIYSNNDAGGKLIVKKLRSSGIRVFPHVIFEDFLRLMKFASVLVGNSSAGIHEAPSFGLPTVNIGSRQQYRERGINVIDVDSNRVNIVKAIEKSLFDTNYIMKVKKGKNPYDGAPTALKIVKILEEIKLPPIQKVINY